MKNNRVISQIASCHDCGKEWQDQKNSMRLAYAHAKRTGHKVSVEVTRAYLYNFRREK